MSCFSKEVKIFGIEFRLRQLKWLIFCCFSPHKHMLKDHLQQLKNGMSFYWKTFKNWYKQPILMQRFLIPLGILFVLFTNSKVWLRNLCVNKNPDNATCINLILTICAEDKCNISKEDFIKGFLRFHFITIIINSSLIWTLKN